MQQTQKYIAVLQKLKTEFDTPAWKRSLMLWLALNLLLSGMGGLAWRLHSPIRPDDPYNLWGSTPIDEGLPGALEGVWLRWDALHYLHIAQEGYNADVVSAFFPLYPLLGHAAGWLLGGDDLGSLLLVSRLAFLLALVVLYKMAAQRFDDDIATFAILFASIYPMGLYWFAPYPLGLALLFSLISLECATKKKWLAAALSGLAAGLTHGTTIPLALGLLTVWFLQVRKDRRAWLLLPATAAPPLGTLLFFAWRIRQGFPPINQLLETIWLRAMQPPWMIVGDFQRFFNVYLGHPDGWINLALFLFGVGMLVVCIRRLEASMWVYQLGMIVYLCMTTNYTTPFGSYGRYLMMAFPSFMALPLAARGKGARLAIVGVWFFSMLFMAMVYFEWGWLA
ncbi:predicted integral membrane protein [Longilinea arvoryzae]|uniref:Predicted integral membrane protein n=1 Tax=Longilinea arvoryzae TaxID=360412 RepID=A0A0S7BGH6_9CHLR|nr:mannosyltransferase family protein [Longilinea arvoryzae]GAP12821.1 predicted integral membrane protein [Longilinea arvoryzae]